MTDCSLSTMGGHSEKVATCRPGSELSPNTESDHILVLNFLDFRTVRNKCLVFKPLSLWCYITVAWASSLHLHHMLPTCLSRSELLSGLISPRHTFSPHRSSHIRLNRKFHWGRTWWVRSGRKRVVSEGDLGDITPLVRSILKKTSYKLKPDRCSPC